MNWDSVVSVWEKVEATSLRNAKTELLAEIWRQIKPNEARALCYMMAGRVAPLYAPIEIGMAEKSLLRVAAWAVKRDISQVTAQYKAMGDLGEVIYQYNKEIGKIPAEKNVDEVYRQLKKVATVSGKGSQEEKVTVLGELLGSLSPQGAKYVMRLVAGKLRLGLLDMTIIDSLSWSKRESKEDRAVLEHAYNVSSDLGLVAEQYLIDPAAIVNWRVRPGVPVRPMRAERLGTIEEIVTKLGECAVEPKLDGMRVQIHAFGGEVENLSSFQGLELSSQTQLFESNEKNGAIIKVFSRGLEDITKMFPEVVAAAKSLWERVGDFVLDGEALGIDASGNYLPFQETMTRKRKYDVAAKAGEKPLRVVVFDTLYANGKDRLGETYQKRRTLLEEMKLGDEVFRLAESVDVTTVGEMKKLFDAAMDKNLEGILVKKFGSVYRAGARDFAWVKYKRAHESELADTIDAVVIGAYVGKGKRNKFGVGAFLVGVRNDDKIVTVAKIGTGLTDEQFGELYNKLMKSKIAAPTSEYEVPKTLTPDIWVAPTIVVEIEADEITVSPLHTAGFALRFPRLLRFREDKAESDITTAAEVRRLFEIGRNRL